MGCSDDPTPPATASAANEPGYPPGPYGVEKGDTIDDLRLTHLDATPFELGSVYRAPQRAALLYVTATWCFTCKPEITWLNGVTANRGDDVLGFAVLLENKSFDKADAADGQAFVDGYHVEFPTLLDPQGELDAFRTSGAIPLNLLVDTRTMRIAHRAFGFDDASLEQAIDTLLKEP